VGGGGGKNATASTMPPIVVAMRSVPITFEKAKEKPKRTTTVLTSFLVLSTNIPSPPVLASPPTTSSLALPNQNETAAVLKQEEAKESSLEIGKEKKDLPLKDTQKTSSLGETEILVVPEQQHKRLTLRRDSVSPQPPSVQLTAEKNDGVEITILLQEQDGVDSLEKGSSSSIATFSSTNTSGVASLSIQITSDDISESSIMNIRSPTSREGRRTHSTSSSSKGVKWADSKPDGVLVKTTINDISGSYSEEEILQRSRRSRFPLLFCS
jgi:hypothetical protein